MLCPECGYDNPFSNHYCGQCGTRLTQICARCAASNPLEYRYCGQCGTLLGEIQPASLPVASRVPEPRAVEPDAQLSHIQLVKKTL